jgi:ABC-type glycerol-3-phosphate transport system substrate-binding protein
MYGKGNPAPAALTAWAFCIGKHAKHPEEGMLLIRWMSERIIKTQYAKAGILPPRYPNFEDPWFEGDAIEVRDLLYLRNYIRNYGKAFIWPPWAFDYWKLAGAELQKMWLKRQSVQETLDNIEQKYNEELLR